MRPEDIVEASFSSVDSDVDPSLLATLRAELVGAWSEKAGVTALLTSVLQKILVDRPPSVVSYMIRYFETLQPKRIVLFGPPASGKRRIGEFLSRRLGLEYVSVRDIVEGVSLTETNIGIELQLHVNKVKKPPSELLEPLIISRLRERDCEDKGWILDGWPYIWQQVAGMASVSLLPSIAISLELPDVVVEDRVSFRLLDPRSGRIYHMTADPPPLGVGARCITRSGESTLEILERLADYHLHLGPTLDALRRAAGGQLVTLPMDVNVVETELEAVGETIARSIERLPC